MTKYCSTHWFGKLSTPMMPSVPPKMFERLDDPREGKRIHEAHDGKIDPRKGRQGSRSRVQIAAPDTEAMGMVRRIERPRDLFRSAAM